MVSDYLWKLKKRGRKKTERGESRHWLGWAAWYILVLASSLRHTTPLSVPEGAAHTQSSILEPTALRLPNRTQAFSDVTKRPFPHACQFGCGRRGSRWGAPFFPYWKQETPSVLGGTLGGGRSPLTLPSTLALKGYPPPSYFRVPSL